jgi:hypothetical protein
MGQEWKGFTKSVRYYYKEDGDKTIWVKGWRIK